MDVMTEINNFFKGIYNIISTMRAGIPAGFRAVGYSTHVNCGDRGRLGIQIPSGFLARCGIPAVFRF